MKKRISLLLLLFASVFSFQSFAETKIASIFGDNMVLQRDKCLPIWGIDDPGTQIVVSFIDFEGVTIVGADGKWKLLLPAFPAGGPYELTVSGTSTKTYINIMVGEVWFASGQSNMYMTVSESNNAKVEIAAANHPDIRLFQIASDIGGEPLEFLSKDEKWEVCSPETVSGFSAAAYYFGRWLQQHYNVPVGLINSSWGGTNIESWISGDMLWSISETRPYIEWVREKKINYVQKRKENEQIYATTNSIIQNAHSGVKANVGLPDYNDSAWKTMDIPIHYHNTSMAGYEGFVWFRKSFELPTGYTGKGLELTLGKIEQRDETFFNMTPVGKEENTGKLRQYFIAPQAVRNGINTIAVKVLHQREEGGGLYEGPFTLVDKGSGKVLLDLSGEWKYSENIEVKFTKAPHYHWHISTIYNYMVAPIVPFAIRGAVWYQGENNADAAYHYRTLLKSLITDWRIQWGQGYFPFIVVQLPMFSEHDPEPSEHGWTELREAQAMATDLPYVTMAVTVDLGDSLDIHPKDKQEVGHRIFLAAQSVAYNEPVVSSGPVYESHSVEGSSIRIRFDMKRNESIRATCTPLTGFAIAGADRKFYWADAVLEGNEVVIKHADIPNPVAVRYAWAPNPALSLFGDSGLPLLPFRTDDWEGITYGKTRKYESFHR